MNKLRMVGRGQRNKIVWERLVKEQAGEKAKLGKENESNKRKLKS